MRLVESNEDTTVESKEAVSDSLMSALWSLRMLSRLPTGILLDCGLRGELTVGGGLFFPW